MNKIEELIHKYCPNGVEYKKIKDVFQRLRGTPITAEKMKEIEKEKEEQQKKQLEEWTNLKIGETIFDSDHDDWSINTSVFNDKIIGRKQLLFIIKDERNEKTENPQHRKRVG